MSSALLLSLFGLLTLRWWWQLWVAFRADLRVAARSSALPDRLALPLAPAVLDTARVPLNRLIAFQGIPRRRAARRRWEGGFGRQRI